MAITISSKYTSAKDYLASVAPGIADSFVTADDARGATRFSAAQPGPERFVSSRASLHSCCRSPEETVLVRSLY